LLSRFFFLERFLLCLKDLHVQASEEFFSTLKYHLERFSSKLPRHMVMPSANHNHDVFNSHFLKEMQELLSASLLSTIIESFYQVFLIVFSFLREEGSLGIRTV
jgi:hypothetical protein